MYWADLENSGVLEECPYKSRKKKIEWLLEYFGDLEEYADEFPCYEPNDILMIFKWLGLVAPEVDYKRV